MGGAAIESNCGWDGAGGGAELGLSWSISLVDRSMSKTGGGLVLKRGAWFGY